MTFPLTVVELLIVELLDKVRSVIAKVELSDVEADDSAIELFVGCKEIMVGVAVLLLAAASSAATGWTAINPSGK
jgi:hypothetical protein